MRAAVLAAGLGERLRAAGYTMPKPLVPVAERPLVDYVLAGLEAAGLRQVACIFNEESAAAADYCRRRWPQLDLRILLRTTPSSMESLFALQPLLDDEPFVAMTVDSICAPPTLADFAARAAARGTAGADVVLAVTSFVDDEKPLWVRRAADGRVLALGPAAIPATEATAGFYWFTPRVFSAMPHARTHGFTALRQLLAHLVERGDRVEAELIGKTIDVDRPEDIVVAEGFLARGCRD